MALPHSHCHDAIALLLRGGRGTVWSTACPLRRAGPAAYSHSTVSVRLWAAGRCATIACVGEGGGEAVAAPSCCDGAMPFFVGCDGSCCYYAHDVDDDAERRRRENRESSVVAADGTV